jgi:K(+)-stimulated pyrophosphate-energized sodium pump
LCDELQVGSIIAAVTLAGSDTALIMLPFWVSGAGIIASVLGFFVVGTKEGARQRDLMVALHKGVIVSSVLVVGFSALIVAFTFQGRADVGWKLFACVVVGLVAGILIGQVTEYFTSYEFWPTKSITKAGVTGPATVIIQGLGIGMISTVFPVIILVATILGCNALSGQYGVALSAVGMLSTLGITLATDAYGPIADNAGGIAEMADLPESVRSTTDALDALGNTTAATGKGFAIGSAVLTALSLLAAFTESAFSKVQDDEVHIKQINIGEPIVLAGVLIGAMLPYLFAALSMLSVQKVRVQLESCSYSTWKCHRFLPPGLLCQAAGSIIIEVRRQFAEIPGLREGTAHADSDTCVAIATQSAVEEMVLPGLLAILSPITVGFLIGPRCLTGLLGGSIASGMMLALMMANAGGAWDNSKKYIEIEGACGGKGTETHKACVVGDTVGDPFKDTSGPSLNILIKLMSIVSLTMAPIMSDNPGDWEVWYYGLIPLFVILIGTYAVYHFFWREVADITADPSTKAKEDAGAAPATGAGDEADEPAKATSLMQGEVEVGEDQA